MKQVGKLFLQGLMAILPIALTIYILFWLAKSAESVLGDFIRFAISEKLYVPGMGVVAGFLIILGIGVLLRIWLFRTLFDWGERTLEKLPLIKTLYSSIRDLMGFFDTSKKKAFSKVVIVTFGDEEVRLIGLVTRENFDELPQGMGDKETVAVYLPMSYQMGGFTVMVPRSRTTPIDISVQQAMRFTLTAGMSIKKSDS